MLDDDEEMIASQRRVNKVIAGNSARPSERIKGAWKELKDRVRGKPKVLEGERIIHINDYSLNESSKFSNNYVSTSKYNLVTFIPKFFTGQSWFHQSLRFADNSRTSEQFSKYANVFFLFTACIQQIPNVSPTNKYTTIAPLALVLLVAAFKEIQEDLVSSFTLLNARTEVGLQKRHQSDSDLNSRQAKVLVGTQFEDKPWRSIKVGDIVRLESNEFFPADLVILSSSEPEGLCYIETSNLDGSVSSLSRFECVIDRFSDRETNLKIKQSSSSTANLTSPMEISRLNGKLRSEQPNNSLYTFEATLVIQKDGSTKDVPLGPDQILLRGAQLRNTAWMYGLVVFTGHETKLMRNATSVFPFHPLT